MDSLKIDATDTTPAVDLNVEDGCLSINGISTEEDALGFYYPVIQWVETYISQPHPNTKMELRLRLFNTASSKALFEIFKRLAALKKEGNHVEVNWYFPEDDESLKEDIDYFNDMTSSLDIKAVSE